MYSITEKTINLKLKSVKRSKIKRIENWSKKNKKTLHYIWHIASSELDMAAMLSQVQCMQIYNPEKRESLLCERRGDGPTEAAATATEAATALGAVRDGAGDGATGRD